MRRFFEKYIKQKGSCRRTPTSVRQSLILRTLLSYTEASS